MDGETIEILGIVVTCIALITIGLKASKEEELINAKVSKINVFHKNIWKGYFADYLSENNISESNLVHYTNEITFDSNDIGYDFNRSSYFAITDSSLHFIADSIKYSNSNSAIKNAEEYDKLFTANTPFNTLKINFADILFFGSEGTISTNAIVSSTGGGSSLAGALIGGVIAGGAGAVIGSRKKNQVYTNLKTTDTRKIEIYFKVNATEQKLTIEDPEIYKQLLIKIPEKEISNYLAINKKHDVVDTDKGSEEKLIKLKALFDKGLIDEEEYKEKKKEILESLE